MALNYIQTEINLRVRASCLVKVNNPLDLPLFSVTTLVDPFRILIRIAEFNARLLLDIVA